MTREPHRDLSRRAAPWAPLFALSTTLLLAACGGGGGSSGGSDPATTRITGSVFAGPLAGASVTVKDAAGRPVAGPVGTGADGSYVVDVPTSALAGPLTFEATGGTFTDEATGAATAGGLVSARAPAGRLGAGSTLHLTPASTVLADLVDRHGRNQTQAEYSVRGAFGFAPELSVRPVNAPGVAAASGLAALRAAAFSQLTHDLGLPPEAQFEVLAALAADLSDGTLDGRDGAVAVTAGGAALPPDVQNRFERALTGFRGSARDRTGLDAGQIGVLPFAKVALTASWRIEYLPIDPGAALGETPFRLRIEDRGTGAARAGLAVSVAPTMHMAGHEHGTPVGAVADGGDGTYAAAVYYSMPGGDPYGYWTLRVTVDDGSGAETATFHPAVGAPSYAVLRGQGDRDPAGARRAYYLFDAGLREEDPALGRYGFDVFVAAREDPWQFPPLAVGAALHDESGAAWEVAEPLVEVSVDGQSWCVAVPATPGRWSVSGLTGIDANAEVLTFYVRLSVNGERKTSDGEPPAADGVNGRAELKSGGTSCCY